MKGQSQLADVFTKALGVPAFMEIISKLGLINIFCNCIIYPKQFQVTEAVSTSEVALVLRGTIKKKKSIRSKGSKVALKNEARLM